MGEIFEYVVPETALTWTGERLTSAVGGQIEIEHLHRYIAARDFCRGLDVLDVASGEGYGTALLAQVAKSATGVEISAEAVSHAETQYGRPDLRYVQGDARRIPLADGSVDVAVSFETIEHFYEQDEFLREIRRVLRPGGLFIVSSPDRDQYSPSGSEANPYHKRELSRAEFSTLLRSHFGNVGLLCQRTLAGSVLMSDGNEAGPTVTVERRGPKHFERSEGVSRSPYLVAFASDTPLPALPNSLYVADSEIGALLARAAEHPALAAALNETRSRAEAAETAFHTSRAELARSMSDTADVHTALAAAEESYSALQAERDTSSAAALTAADERNAALKAERDTACAQRDAARLALRRANASPGAHILAVSDARIAALHEQIEELKERAIAAELVAHEWSARYHALRNRFERLYIRSGLFRLSRLVPRSIRQSVGRAVLSSRS